MRTFAIILVAAFVFLLSQQLPAESRGRDRDEQGASQAVLTGVIACSSPESIAVFDVHQGLGVLAIPSPEPPTFGVRVDHAEDCSVLLSDLAEQVPHRTCEVATTIEISPGVEGFGVVCAGRADAVISAVGKMAKAMIRLQI